MKKICIFLSIFLFVTHCPNCGNVAESKTNSSIYAKVLQNCVLYKSIEMKDNFDDVYFIVPESYFVVILEEFDKCYKVQYDKYIGYAKKNYLDMASFVPVDKFLQNVTFDIKETSGTQIWNKPSVSGNVLTTLPANTKSVKYIAYALGEIPTGGNSNIWYYILYTPSTNPTNVYEGYVYSENVTNLSEIVYNAETNPEVIEEVVDEKNVFNISSTIKTVVVAIISIPIILLISIILYKLIKKIKENTKYAKNTNNYIDEIQEDNSSNINQIQNNNNEFVSKSVLKTKINDMRNTNFTKIQHQKNKFKNNFPSFPSYENEDDLL